jgi:hypothetical protein
MMQAALYRYQIDDRVNEAIRLGHNEFVPMIEKLPGFVAHYAIELGKDDGLLLAIFDDDASIQQFVKLAEDWVQKRVVPTLGAPYDQPPTLRALGNVKALNTPSERRLNIP